jgi:hypothetical protein
MPSLHPLLYSRGCSQPTKFFMGRWPWILSFREKKQNSDRAKGVGVLSILAKVNLLKKIDLSRPNCINRLKHSHGTENQKINLILLKMSKAVRTDILQCSLGFKALKKPF